MATNLSSLPLEVLFETLSYLSVSSLLAFGQTNRYNHAAGTASLRSLRIGAFPSGRRVNLLTRLLDLQSGGPPTINIKLDHKPTVAASVVVHSQNQALASVLDRHGSYLNSLEVSLWGLEDSLAASLAKLTRLRHLSIRMDSNPFSRGGHFSPRCRLGSEPGTAWNWLYDNSGSRSQLLGRLRSLRLDCSGITDYQLRRILETNPSITELRLSKCTRITEEFWVWLANSRFASRLKVLHFTDSFAEEADNRVLPHLDAFTALESLSLLGCMRMDSDAVQQRNDEVWGISECTGPSPPPSPVGVAIAVDPLYDSDLFY